jgi:ribonuclease R
MDADLRAAILAYVSQPAYKPAKPKVIAERLGLVDGDRIDAVKRVVKKMVKAGELEFGPSHLVLPKGDDHPSREHLVEKPKKPKSDKHVTGVFRRTASGFGFVRPEGTAAAVGRDADIFVSEKNAGDAADGDMVRIRIDSHTGYKGKPEGRVIDIIERSTNRFVGTYFERSGMGLVQVDGKVFSEAVYVGDAGAKGVADDDKVVIEMVRFPSHVRDGEAVIVEVLGHKGKPGVDTLSVIYEFGLPGEFPDDVLDDARKQAAKFDESIGEDRRDLTGETIVTIDPIDARDFDDAISLKRIENNHWLLHFVQPKTPLDREAYDRATSVYLPDRVIPMLPEVISNNLASLQPDKVRYAMTCEIEFSAEGVPIAAEVFKSAIKSCRRFAYEEVDEFLADRKAWREKLTPAVHTLLGHMHELAMILRRRRFTRGSLELHMPEIKIDLDKEGKVSGAHVEQNTESHQMIEEFMLAANEAVARRLDDAGLIFLRRVHGEPDPRKLRQLTEFVRELGFACESLESRFELQRLLDASKDDPRSLAVNFSVLRSMQRAIYSPEDEGHYALASDNYCHFTSPIRRYPDLTVHRLIEQLARGQKPRQELDVYFKWGDHCSEREQRATSAERELKKVKLLNFLSDKIGLEMDGVVTGVESFGIFVTGRQLPAEGFIHISALADDYYKFDRATHSISGFRSGNTFRLGDMVRVAVAAVEVDKRELDFRLIGRGEAAPGRAARSERGKPPQDKRPRRTKAKAKTPRKKGKRRK